jgi:CRISPR-associated protein Cas5t
MRGSNELTVAKITIEAPVASFRYPHFLVGRQPTYDMPPPSTIYGHIASAMGELPDPRMMRFGYHFTAVSRAKDLEHQHIIWQGSPDKLSPEESAKFKVWHKAHSLALAAAVQPTLHDFLFGCRLVLYVDPPAVAEAFADPVFCTNFGRSQDLAKIEKVETINLVEAEGAYIESTLLPFRPMRTRTGYGVTALMPRYIGPPPEREPEFDTYIVLHEMIFAGKVDDTVIARNSSKRLINTLGQPKEMWLVDPDSPGIASVHRAVIFHRFVTEQ